MSNILEAICNIIAYQSDIKLINLNLGKNKINNVGDALESLIKDAFANCISETDSSVKLKKHSDVFSWLGRTSSPPDIILKGGDAIEVKKLESTSADIALNSSCPKSMLFSDDPMILKDCKVCEDWNKKDLIYTIGTATKESGLTSLWMVYGTIYAAHIETYHGIKKRITDGLQSITNIEFAITKELGRVNRVDPLGITNLRVRGMWSIQHPIKVFNYLPIPKGNKSFELIVILPNSKYNSFPNDSRERLQGIKDERLIINDVYVKNPNNPANLIEAKLIVYQR